MSVDGMKVVKNTVPPSSVAADKLRSPGVSDGVRRGSLKVVNQPSMFWTVFTRLPPPALNAMSKLDVLPVVLTFAPDAQLEQVTTLEELNRLFRSTVWSVHPPETMQSFTPKKCWMSTLPLSAVAKYRPVPKNSQRLCASSCVSVGAAVIGPTLHGELLAQVVAFAVVYANVLINVLG